MTLGTTLLIDVQKLVECPICRESFVDPLQLSCGHSFCKSCLDKLRAAQSEGKSANVCDLVVRCPECRQDTRLPLTGLPINYRLRDMAALVTSTSTLAISTHADSKKEKCCSNCTLCGDASTNGVFMSCPDCAIIDKRALQMCPVCCLIYHNGHNIVERLEGDTLSTSLTAFLSSSHQKYSSQQPSKAAESSLNESILDFQQRQPQGIGTSAMERTILSEITTNYTNEEVVHETYTDVQERHEDTTIEVNPSNTTLEARTPSESAATRGLFAVIKCKKYCNCTMFTLIVIGLQYFACFVLFILVTHNKI